MGVPYIASGINTEFFIDDGTNSIGECDRYPRFELFKPWAEFVIRQQDRDLIRPKQPRQLNQSVGPYLPEPIPYAVRPVVISLDNLE